jgi:hypothetical protein
MVAWVSPLGFLLASAAFSTCIYKRNYTAAFVGVFLPFVLCFGAFRLARPNSWWARRFYRGSNKMRRAEARHGARVAGEREKGWGPTLDAPPRWS